MTIIQKIKEITTAIPKYCNKQTIKRLFDEQAEVSHNYLMNQLSYIEANIKSPFKEIYKADVISKVVSGENLLEG